MLDDVHYRWFGIIPKGMKVAAMLDDVHYRWFGIIPKGMKVAAMLDDVHYRWFGIMLTSTLTLYFVFIIPDIVSCWIAGKSHLNDDQLF